MDYLRECFAIAVEFTLRAVPQGIRVSVMNAKAMRRKMTIKPLGPIDAGSDEANKIGFTSDLFEGYIYMNCNEVIISLVESIQPRRGNLSRFVSDLIKAGFTVKIPTPLPKMLQFVKKHGFKKTDVIDPTMGRVEVWTKG